MCSFSRCPTRKNLSLAKKTWSRFFLNLKQVSLRKISGLRNEL